MYERCYATISEKGVTALTKQEELALFTEKADDFIASSYILADIKIMGLLKAIAQSETLLAVFKNCLTDFDYAAAQRKYLVKSKYLSEDKGEFVLPPTQRELLAFVFNILVDTDAKRIDLAAFINKYFYEDGSFSAGYAAFIGEMIKPFCNAVKSIMESVIDGSLQDPADALREEEERKVKEKELAEKEKEREKNMLEKSYGKSLKEIKRLLLLDKMNIKKTRMSEEEKREALLLTDMFGSVLDGADKDAIDYAFTAYKYLTKAHTMLFYGRVKKITALLKDVLRDL